MTKFIAYILVVILLTSLKTIDENDCIENIFKQSDISLKNNYQKIVSKDPDGKSNVIDSLNFLIERRWTRKKILIQENITNKTNDITRVMKYNENGILIEKGYMTSSRLTPIGTWKYYSKQNVLDSIINYDKLYKVSFCDFYNLSKEKGFDTASYYHFDNQSRVWSCSKDIGVRTAKSLTLQVDSMTFRQQTIHWEQN